MSLPRRLLPALLACLLLAACSGEAGGFTVPPSSTTQAPPSTSPTTTTVPDEGQPGVPNALPAKAAFAAYQVVPRLEGTPAQIPAHPTSLSGVFWDFKVPAELAARLASDGFAISGAFSSDVLHAVYSYEARYADGPVYVTTDAGYHEWHLVFSKALRDIEQQELLPLLEQLVSGLLGAARLQQPNYAGTPLEQAAADVTQHLEAAATLLGLDVGEIGDRAAAEVALAEQAAELTTSPTVGVEVDYTLFTPRGHYTLNEDLTRYFRAMALLGSTPFPIDSPEAVRRFALLAQLLAGDPTLEDAWQRIYAATAFLVGSADDYTPTELDAAVAAVATESGAPVDLSDDSDLAAVAAALRAARPVLIDAESASLRTMGARFVLDSYLLDQLVHPQVWQRLEASVLDVAAAFGSDWAYGLQEAAGVPAAYPGYEDRILALRDLVAQRPAADWGSTVYDAWLYAILPMWQAHGTEYPDYMQTEAWAARAHQAGFGSYTELKHDTVLYTKQAFAEGDEPLPPAPPRHWVEPDPVPFERLAAAARLLRDGLADRDLLASEAADLLDDLIALEERFGRIARDELAGRPISAEDNDWLAAIGSEFELLWLAAGEGEGGGLGGFADDPDSKAPVVVDIFSNPENALEIATGGFDTMYVLVPNDAGQWQVAVGATYAFYEFWVPRGERLTDDEWRALLATSEAPARPAWLASLYD